MISIFPVLLTPLFTVDGYTLYLYGAFQHTSSLLGLGVLFWWGIKWNRSHSPKETGDALANRTRILLLVILLGPPVAIAIASGYGHLDDGTRAIRQLQLFVRNAIFSGGTSFIVWLLVVGLVWRRAFLKAPAHQSGCVE